MYRVTHTQQKWNHPFLCKGRNFHYNDTKFYTKQAKFMEQTLTELQNFTTEIVAYACISLHLPENARQSKTQSFGG